MTGTQTKGKLGVCMCVSICICMSAYQKSLYGFINPTVVLVSYLVHKATTKQLVISVPYVLSEILISEVFDSTLEKRYLQKSAFYYMQRPTAYFRSIKDRMLYHLVI